MDAYPHAHVAPGARIGPRTVIGPGAVITDGVTIGADCVIGPNAVIGVAGFGYTHNTDGTWTHRPHQGGVVIEDDVHVGALSNVHGGTVEPTVIGRGTRVDALVHVGHNVRIGEDCIIVAHVSLGGSTVVEDGAYVGLGASVHQHRRIGARALVGLGAAVIRDVPPDVKVAGVPTRVINETVGVSPGSA